MGIRQALMSGLSIALKNANLDHIMPDTYFKSVITTIQNWQENYKDTYDEFKKHIDCSVKNYITELENFNIDYYENFKEIYPSLTAGSEFNPISNIDVIELYNSVNKSLKKEGYTGIYVIYDEFSKFLEGNLNKTSAAEIKTLQDFAENCCRTKEQQLHILLISHQSILNYVDKLPKNKIDAWKAVSNRFKTLEFNTSLSQQFDLMSKIICQESKWYKEYLKDNEKRFNNMLKKWEEAKSFSRIIFIVPKKRDKINEQIIKYDAIKYLIDNTDDEILSEELSYSLNALSDVISNFIDIYLRPELNQSKYYYNGHEELINRRSALSKKLSEICEETYKDYPLINNEVLNKNTLSSQAINSRSKVVAGILENHIKEKVNDFFSTVFSNACKIDISPDYKVKMIDSDGEVVGTGGAQGITLVLAFIVSLLRLAYDIHNEDIAKQGENILSAEPYPLVLDAPFSSFSEANMLEVAPKIANLTGQVIIFSKDPECRIIMNGDIKHKIGKFYELKPNELVDEEDIDRMCSTHIEGGNGVI